MTIREDLQVGIRGWIEVKLINREGRIVHEHIQNNLILNKGLDYIMSSLTAQNMHLYIAVGTGSTAPAPSQTALASEIARTNQTLSLGPDIEITALANGHYRISRTRGFDYGQANGNLTEFGGSESSSPSGGVNMRELFRDGNGNPIVITKTSNERLAITYHLEVQLSPASATDYGTVNILDGSGNVIGSRLVRHLFTRPSPSTIERTIDLSLVAMKVYRHRSGAFYEQGGTVTVYWRTDLLTAAVDMGYTADQTLGPAGSNNSSWSTYTTGTFYRELSHELGPETSDRTIYGYLKGNLLSTSPTTTGRSYAAAFVNADGTPNPFVKNKDYRFKVTTRFTISRL